MLSVLLSILLVLSEAVLCVGLACPFAGAAEPLMAPSTADLHASLADALAELGRGALEVAFSGVVRVGEAPAAAGWPTALDC